VLRDVFKKGDSWFRSGDLLYKDAKGLWHFVDRIGDTFRNVSTMEVSQVLSSLPGVEEANVYGVQVPGEADGRACMVALRGQDLQSREKLDALQSLCEKELPSYARPRFLRFLSDMDITGTFKHQKVQLRDQGFDPAKVPDPVYILHPESKRYEPLDPQVISQLQQGRSKLLELPDQWSSEPKRSRFWMPRVGYRSVDQAPPFVVVSVCLGLVDQMARCWPRLGEAVLAKDK
ncbi:unnamed protein product, partial [Cladocopium goreaui]